MNKQELLKVAFDMHADISEKSTLLSRFLKASAGQDVFEDIRNVIDFFNKNLTLHFLKEDALIRILVKNNQIAKEHGRFFLSLVNEHQTLLNDFNEVKELSKKLSTVNFSLTEEFVKKCNKLIADLAEHAQSEDNTLYPVAEKNITDIELKRLENEIAKLVNPNK